MIGWAHAHRNYATSHYHFPAFAYGSDGMEHIGATSRLGYSRTYTGQGAGFGIGAAYQDCIDLFSTPGAVRTPSHPACFSRALSTGSEGSDRMAFVSIDANADTGSSAWRIMSMTAFQHTARAGRSDTESGRAGPRRRATAPQSGRRSRRLPLPRARISASAHHRVRTRPVARRRLAGHRPAVPGIRGLLIRYLTAFGPATVQDMQAWPGLTRLGPVINQLRKRLRTFTDEKDRVLLDVSDGPLPDPATPAPPRFLPPFDNAILSHADRSRILAPGDRPVIYRDRLLRVFLVAGTWQINGATIHVRPIRALRATDQRSVEEEAERLLTFLLPHESAPDVRIDLPP